MQARRIMVRHRLKTISRFLAWGSIIALAVLSLIPTEQMMRTALTGRIEHFVAYAGTACIAATAFGERGLFRLIFALLIYAGSLEFLQRFSPGRTSSILDFMFSGTGVLLGVGAFALLARWLSIEANGQRPSH
jgi:VanZ family protein